MCHRTEGYCLHVTTDDRRAVATAIVLALGDARRSRRWLSDTTGIAYSTLRRKLRGDVDLSVTDLARIAAALDVPPASLLPRLDPTGEVAGPER